jgi:dTDP-4-amino-4,6-dideoxygalactose transaminase
MPNINAALGVAQLENLDKFVVRKREVAATYQRFFAEAGIRFFKEPEFARSNYWLNVVLLETLEERNTFLEDTNKNGVMTRPLWTLATKLPMFKECFSMPLPNAVWFEDRVANIPSSVLPE